MLAGQSPVPRAASHARGILQVAPTKTVRDPAEAEDDRERDQANSLTSQAS